MRFLKFFSLGYWLKSKSINQRLGFQAGSAILLSFCLVAVLAGGSYVSLGMIQKDNDLAGQALSSALLEKDFASLERDVFRYALLQNEETKADYEGNVTDFRQAVAEAQAKLGQSEQAQLLVVSKAADVYVATVNQVIGSGNTGVEGVNRIMEKGDIVDASIEEIRDPVIAKSAAIAVAQESLSTTIMGITILIAILAGLSSFVIARVIKKAISSELDAISGSIKKVLAGDLDIEIQHAERNDDVGELARAAVQLRDTSRAKRQSDAEMIEMAQQVGECLQRMSRGDLTVKLGQLGENYAGLREDFNRTINQLHDTLSSVAESAHSIRIGSNEISSASDDLAQRTEHHAGDMARIAEAINEISSTLSETAGSAAEADRNVAEAMAETKDGGAVVKQAVHAMTSIEESTEKIEQIIAVIDGIAFQTNLLALNAGVEAARAGDAGSGFAVVANEVRALAQRSADAAKDIKGLIQTSSNQVANGADMVRKTGAAFERINERISSVSALVEQISTKAEQQSHNLKETNRSMSNVEMVTQNNAAMVEESTAAARNLASSADSLAQLVSQFSLREQSSVSAIHSINARQQTTSVAATGGKRVVGG
ncbi:methyl-accepting chemotaxis protein [Henriciella mobilis]|uniref:methyl-accepting chemotaxis protein n=1 Tax=Henriciella mobilis TaxID=2305467 RepID=UPI000E6717BF|nr:methyl-accepting chemotaxis protein [Henriciella mobilis]RIJ18213.1 methyl-accepting chemotaxis protein [Henriciella mobilis]RIJ24980.1 methyl-accepting chemotaxis protein [Henriciella mobilis]